MSARKAGPWHVDEYGYTVREFLDDSGDVAASAFPTSWSAFARPRAMGPDWVKGAAVNIEEAKLQADAQLRAWGFEVAT